MFEDGSLMMRLCLQSKKVVYIQVVFIKLGEIDTVKETFSADIFIQARWREPKLDGDHNARTTVLASTFVRCAECGKIGSPTIFCLQFFRQWLENLEAKLHRHNSFSYTHKNCLISI